MRAHLRRAALGLFVVGVLGLALTALHRELAEVRYHQVAAEIRALPGLLVARALLLTAGGYAVSSLYDWLALRFVRRPQPLRTTSLVGFLANAFSNTVGFSLISGGSVRHRFYSAAGLQAGQTAQAVAFVAATFWLGFLTLAGAVLIASAPVMPAGLPALLRSSRALGLAFLLPVLAFAALSVARRRPVRIGGFTLGFPSPRTVAAQLTVGALDWFLAGAVLATLLRPLGLPFGEVLALFLLAQVVGVVSHVPGGMGVFESVFVLLLSGRAPVPGVVGALVAFRAVYYLVPFTVAAATFLAIELSRRRRTLSAGAVTLARWARAAVPSVFAAATFLAGTVLLASGATPSVHLRVRIVRDVLGLPVVETSHLLASVVGLLLLLLARGLQRRLDGARVLALALLVAGSVLSLFKGLDWEEALLLGALALALALAPFRRSFYRRSSLLAERFSGPWITAVACVLVGTTWLGLFAHPHVRSERGFLSTLTAHADDSRFLRATAGVATALVLLGFARLLSSARLRRRAAPAADLDAARAVVSRSPDTTAHLALTGDKAFLFNDARSAFIMYGAAGRSLIAMGDPVGPAAEARELAWRFHELADRLGAYTVFYQVGGANLPIYRDLGLQVQKLGEEALVDLDAFSLDGRQRKGLRSSVNRLQREGVRFEVKEPGSFGDLLPRLRLISDAWLAGKHTDEKAFSLGAFDPRYLADCPLALLWHQDRVVAFANLWVGARRRELSVDLMRFHPDAPAGAMDYLFVDLMAWGRQRGFARFNLGMAPLSGVTGGEGLPLWSKLAALLYRHGEHFYNFRGLRAYKDKFGARWQPKYLASPAGLALPVVIANLISLVSGGLLGSVTRSRERWNRSLAAHSDAA